VVAVKTRVVVIDDHPLITEGARAWFALHTSSVAVVGQAPTVASFLESGIEADVVLLDVDLGDHSDPRENVEQLVEKGMKVLVVSSTSRPEDVIGMIGAKALGYVTKNCSMEDLRRAIYEVKRGVLHLSSELAFLVDTAAGRANRWDLSDQQKDIVKWYARGFPMKNVALRLGITVGSANKQLQRAKAKFAVGGYEVHTRMDVAKVALDEGLI
jgi:DNA-binding NarL/FixJ family response regulator